MRWTPNAIRGVGGWIYAGDLSGLYQDAAHSTLVTANGQAVKAAQSLTGGTNYFTDTTGFIYSATGFAGGLPCITSAAAGKLTATTAFPALCNSNFAIFLCFSHDGTANRCLFSANSATNAFYLMPRASDYMFSMGTGNGSGAFNQAATAADTPEIVCVTYDGENYNLYFARAGNRRHAGGGQTIPRIAKSGSSGLSGVPLILGAYIDNTLKPSGFKVRELITVNRCPSTREIGDIMGYLAANTPVLNIPGVIYCGDSLTNSYNVGTTNPYADSDTYPYKCSALLTASGIPNSAERVAYSGRYLKQHFAEADADLQPNIWRQTDSRTVVVIWFGANDLTALGVDGLLATVKEACARVAADGGIPVPINLVNRGDNPAFDALRLAYNVKFNRTVGTFASRWGDIGSDPVLGASAVVDNLTLVQSDKIHYTPAGNDLVAQFIFNVVRPVLLGRHDIIDYTPGRIILSTGIFNRPRRLLGA